MTANVSSSSVPAPPETDGIDLLAPGLQQLGGLSAALLSGRDQDLLAPLRFLSPGELPPLPPIAAPARRDLAAGLAASNRSYGHPEADHLARRLADPATRVVITGQQPGILGGPLYTLTKAVAAARYAAALEAAGVPAIALFWVATEDHDYAEVSRVAMLGPAGPQSFALPEDPEPLRPVGMRSLGPGITPLIAAAAGAMATPGAAEWLQSLATWYRPEARFGEAFCRLFVRLLGARCPLLVDALHPALKAAERPSLTRLIVERAAVEERLQRREAALLERGHETKVAPQRRVSPLFLLHGSERRRIEWRDGERFALRGRNETEGTIADLLRIVDDNPSIISPGALARPGVQDAVFGTSIQVLGPGELAYMAQAAALYPVLAIEEPPWAALRPQVVVVEERQREKLAELGLPLTAAFQDRESLERMLAARSGADFVGAASARVAAVVDELRDRARAVDPNLERPWEKTREQVTRALELFGQKVAAAAAKGDEVVTRRLEQLRATCVPGGTLQERVICSAYFPARYGDAFIPALWDQLSLDPRRLQVVAP